MSQDYKVIISKSYRLGTYETTVAQFRLFVKETEYMTSVEQAGDGGLFRADNGEDIRKPEYTWKHSTASPGDNYPVGQLSWNDATEFCKWLSRKERKTYRLPTEAEWEWACRAGNSGKYHYGDDPNILGDYAWYSENSHNKPHPVGQKKPNAWGLFDMHGNIGEYCLDQFADYPSGTVIDPRGPMGGRTHSIRSFGFFDPADALMIGERGLYSEDRSMNHFGFRLLCEESAAAR
jgi:eukaryotic-like serine/threonine-protein kinase